MTRCGQILSASLEKITSMESPAGRLLALLSLLQARPHWSAAELAERLATTPRTVRRDVTRLRDLGYPVLAEPGPHGGYQLGAGGALPPLLLSDDEAVAVAIGLRLAAEGGAVGLEDAAIAALAKLQQVLPARLRERINALSASTVLLPSRRAGPATDPDVLLTLAQACRRPERLRFVYHDGSGRVSQRRVEPYRLVNAVRRWYLVAHDLDRKDWRTFRVDRLSEPALTGHPFERSVEPDAATMVNQALTVAPYRWQAEILVRTDVSTTAGEIPPTVGTLEPVEGGTLVRMGANELDWIARFLAGIPLDYEVRHPPELRAALRALGHRLVRAHQE
jgi:predicted DNA-binding transcriptional regulator YafY